MLDFMGYFDLPFGRPQYRRSHSFGLCSEGVIDKSSVAVGTRWVEFPSAMVYGVGDRRLTQCLVRLHPLVITDSLLATVVRTWVGYKIVFAWNDGRRRMVCRAA